MGVSSVGLVPSTAASADPVATQVVTINSTGGDAAGKGLRIAYGSGKLQVFRNGTGQLFEPSTLPTAPNANLGNAFALSFDDGNGDVEWVNPRRFRTITAYGGSTSGSGTITSRMVARYKQRNYFVDLTISYVYPNDYFTESVRVTVPSGNTATVRAYQYMDTYLGGSDQGPGYYNASPSTAGVTGSGVVEALQRVSGPAWSGYYSALYSHLEDYPRNGTDYPDIIDPNPATDNGVGISYDLGSAAGSQTMVNNVIFAAPTPALSASFGPAGIKSGMVTTLTFRLSQPNSDVAATGLGFSATLPTGLTIDTFPASNSCAGSLNAPTGGHAVTLSNAALPSGTPSCTVEVAVTASTPGSYPISAGDVTTTGLLENLAAGAEPALVVADWPGAPTGVSGQAGNASAVVTFTAPGSDGGAPITGYEVSFDNGESWAPAPTSTGPAGTLQAQVLDLVNGTSYDIVVRAVNAVGAGSQSTSVATVTPQATVPSAPLDLGIMPGDMQGTVYFLPPDDDGGAAITTYEVSTNGGDTWNPLSVTPDEDDYLKGSLTSLANGTTYQVKVRARNIAGAGAASETATVTPRAAVPGPPIALLTTAADHAAKVQFLAPLDDGGSPITAYEVSINGGETWTALPATTNPNGVHLANVTGLTNGITYQLKVRARNANGAGDASLASAVTPLGVPDVPQPVATVPTAPIEVTASATSAGATIAFRAPVSDGGSVITAYQVSTDGGATWTAQPATVSPTGTHVMTLTGLTGGRTYQVKVRAVNVIGAGAASEAATVTPAAPTPDPTPEPPTPAPAPANPVRINLDLALKSGETLAGTQATLTGGGLKSSSKYVLTMYSTPVVIASGQTNSMGGFRATIRMPRKACVLGGLHRLVLTGTAPDGGTVQDANWILMNDTCAAQTGSGTKPAQAVPVRSFLFPYLSARLSLTAKRSLRSAVSSMRGAKGITITGYTQTGKQSKAARAANRALALRRAKAVRAYLLTLRVRTPIRVVGAGGVDPVNQKKQNLNRRVTIVVRY
ncbi:fibronectin type III domain-containing protein [Actinoplanes sp. TFC3]|uniref:fibronectin type III domain-containing protein n=1 Tax=Actinoplanes sp. TFC3 TaxID=1710355 RepID=UPI000829F7FA|nr:fibronectin type III domain-containing protein [Actinoplanes sp. TFC3]